MQNTPHDLSNGKGDEVPAEVEMEALEMFGPEVREFLCNAPIKLLAITLLLQADEQGIVGNLKLPIVDHAVAQRLKNGIMKELLKDRSEIDARAGLVPLVSRKRRRV